MFLERLTELDTNISELVIPRYIEEERRKGLDQTGGCERPGIKRLEL